jgi:hypothetical protein
MEKGLVSQHMLSMGDRGGSTGGSWTDDADADYLVLRNSGEATTSQSSSNTSSQCWSREQSLSDEQLLTLVGQSHAQLTPSAAFSAYLKSMGRVPSTKRTVLDEIFAEDPGYQGPQCPFPRRDEPRKALVDKKKLPEREARKVGWEEGEEKVTDRADNADSDHAPPPVVWKFVQSFGDDCDAYTQDLADDVVTSIEFRCVARAVCCVPVRPYVHPCALYLFSMCIFYV